jgi:FMN phosphatase YigB (HAD superfamily)
MEERERIEVVVVTCEDTLVDLDSGVEALLYRTARRHGEAPLDRGRALRRQLAALEAPTLADGYEALAAARGYRWAEPGELAVAAAAAACRPFPDVAAGLEEARAQGVPVVAVADADRDFVEAALRPIDGAFDALFAGCGLAAALRALGLDGCRVLHIAARQSALRAAATLEGLGARLAAAQPLAAAS